MGPYRTGSLRIYLAGVPGAGKTVALADEGRRCASQGSDVVVALADSRGRVGTESRLVGLEVVAPTSAGQIDVAAVKARRPEIALVDDLGATWVAGGERRYRWQDAEQLLDAGLDVIATLAIGSIESLADVVSEVTGIERDDRVPDAFVARATQIELVDIAPESLRARLARGDIVAADELDTETSRLFAPATLASLRKLAVTWFAANLRRSPGPAAGSAGEEAGTRERVLIALSGAPDGERLIRRAARLAARIDGDLLGVVAVVTRADEVTADRLRGQRRLLEQVGGSYHEVEGADVVDILLQVARAEGATQLVMGASPRNRFGRSLINELLANAEGIDIHVVGGSGPRGRRPALRLPKRRRQLTAAISATVALPLVTAVMASQRDRYSLSVALLAYVVVVVAVTSVGGALVGFGGAVAAFLFANFFFTQPVHSFTVNDSDDAVALLVFLLVTAIVSAVVNLERRWATEADVANREAEAVATAAEVLARASDPIEALVDHLSLALDTRPTVLEHHVSGEWREMIGRGGAVASNDPAILAIDDGHRLRIGGEPLTAPLRRVAGAVASQLATAIQSDSLRQASERDRSAAAGDAYRTALLRAVSHDLRTPLTSIKTSVSSLLSQEVSWSDAETAEFLDVIDTEADRLERLIANLLDMSRLQGGGIHARMSAVALVEVVAAALATLTHLPPGRCRLVVDHDDALAYADPALLERVVANLVANADRAAPVGTEVLIRVGVGGGDSAQIQVVDRGPGIPASHRVRLLEPFARLDDRSPGSGIGLGLAIVQGFVCAMNGELDLDDTPGGGLTATIRLARPQGVSDNAPDRTDHRRRTPDPPGAPAEPESQGLSGGAGF